jgi:hypothetical protein
MIVASVGSVRIARGSALVGFADYGAAASVRVTFRPQRFGGFKAYFRCPGCDRCCGILYAEPYIGATGWKCRICWQLAYPSQRQRSRARAWAYAQRLSEELADPSAPQSLVKPKGMHNSTFRKRLRQISELESRAVLPALQRLMGTAR